MKKKLTNKQMSNEADVCMDTCSVVLTFEFIDETLWCKHLNETSLSVLLYATLCFLIFSKLKFGFFLEV